MFRIMRADFYERTRRWSYWALVLIALFMGVICSPRSTSSFKVFTLGPDTYKQASNPTWIPISVCLIVGLFLPIVEYIYLKNAIGIDQEYDVSTLMETMQFSKFKYILGKFLSGCLLIFGLLCIVMIGTFGMILIRFSGRSISLGQFFNPFLVMVPGIILIAILSLFSEAMPFLRSTFGTDIVSILIFITYMTGALVPNSIFTKIISFSGDNYLIRAINQASINAIGEPLKGSFLLLAGNTNEKATGTKALIFPTISFSAQDKLALICQLGLLILLILLTVLVFSPHRYQNKSMLKVKRFSDRAVPPIVAKEKLHPIEGHSANIWQLLRLSFVQLSSSVSTYVKLALLILWLLSFVLPKTIDIQTMLPLIFLVELPFLGSLGVQAHATGFYPWLKTVNHGQVKQGFFEFLAGFITTFLLVIPIIFKAFNSSLLLLSFSLFIVLLAQFLGSLTKDNRMFIFLMVIFWFIYLNGRTLILPIGQNTSLATMIYLGLTLILFVFQMLLNRVNK